MAATPEGRLSFALDMVKHGTDRATKARTDAAAKVAETTDDGEFYALSSFAIEALVDANATLKLWATLAKQLANLEASIDNGEVWLPVVADTVKRETAYLVENRHECRSTSSAARMMGEADRDAAAKFVRELNALLTLATAKD